MSASTPEERLRIALELAETGELMMRSRLRREHPDWTEDAFDSAITAWRQDRPGAPFGDYPGQASRRALLRQRP